MCNEMLEAIPFHNFQHFTLGSIAFQGHIYVFYFVAVSKGRGSPGLNRQEVDPVPAKLSVNEECAPGWPLAREERQKSGVIRRGMAAVCAMGWERSRSSVTAPPHQCYIFSAWHRELLFMDFV